MKKIIYILIALPLFFINTSCGDQYAEDEPLILTTRNSEIEVPIRPLDVNLGQVLGFSTQGPVSFSLIEQSVEGAISISPNGDILVEDESAFDLDINPTITANVLVVKDGIEKTATITLKLGYRDTDGDGVYDFEEVNNDSDPNDPCDPEQPEEYKGYDVKNLIWMNADCDGDGISNGAEDSLGSDPYSVCVDDVNTAVWDGPVSVEDVGYSTIITTAIKGCRRISIKGDLVDYAAGECVDTEDVLRFTFIPESEGATKGAVVIKDQEYLPVCFGFGDRIFSQTPGTYDEETGEIIVDYVIYYDEFDQALFEAEEYFGGTFSIKPVDE